MEMRKRQFRVESRLGYGYWVAEVHETGWTSQVGRVFKYRKSAENHLDVVLRCHRPQYVPTYAAMQAKEGNSG